MGKFRRQVVIVMCHILLIASQKKPALDDSEYFFLVWSCSGRKHQRGILGPSFDSINQSRSGTLRKIYFSFAGDEFFYSSREVIILASHWGHNSSERCNRAGTASNCFVYTTLMRFSRKTAFDDCTRKEEHKHEKSLFVRCFPLKAIAKKRFSNKAWSVKA